MPQNTILTSDLYTVSLSSVPWYLNLNISISTNQRYNVKKNLLQYLKRFTNKQQELGKILYFSNMTASANDKNQKVVPILVSYFNKIPGDNVKVLGLDVLPGATSDQLNDFTFSALSTIQWLIRWLAWQLITLILTSTWKILPV